MYRRENFVQIVYRKSKPFQEKAAARKSNCTLLRVNMEIPQKQSGHWRFKYKKHIKILHGMIKCMEEITTLVNNMTRF